MDGPRPNEELYQAPNVTKVLKFRDQDQFFILDKLSTSALVVIRPMNKDDDVRPTAHHITSRCLLCSQSVETRM